MSFLISFAYPVRGSVAQTDFYGMSGKTEFFMEEVLKREFFHGEAAKLNGGSVKTEFLIEEAEKLNLIKALWNTGVDVKFVSCDIAVPGNFCRESSEAEFFQVNVVN